MDTSVTLFLSNSAFAYFCFYKFSYAIKDAMNEAMKNKLITWTSLN